VPEGPEWSFVNWVSLKWVVNSLSGLSLRHLYTIVIRLGKNIEDFGEITTWCEETFGPSLPWQENVVNGIDGSGWRLSVDIVPERIMWLSQPDHGYIDWPCPYITLQTTNPSWETFAALRWE